MTSRAARDNNIFRLLFMPALAIGLVVGCAPASSGGGGGSVGGQAGGNVSQGGNTGGPAGNGPAGNGPAGNGPAGNGPAGNGPAGNGPAGNGPAGNGPAGNGPAGNTGNPGGTISNPGGTTSNPGGTTTSPGGTTTSSGGTTKASGGTTSNPGGTTTSPGGTTTSSGGTTKASGGTTTASGGTTAPGGSTGSSAGSTGSTGNPPGWWQTSDWGVTSVNWHGCVWTGVDCKTNCPAGITAVPASTTSVSPADFTAAAKEGGPYQVTGSVFNDYNSVVLLGFDLNDTPKGDATQCSSSKRSPAADGPPAVTMPSGATGIAINWSAAKLPSEFRIQIQGVKGATDPNNRWCASIPPTSPSFVPFSSFSTTCWNTTGTKYNNEPISGIAFLAPGTTSTIRPFDFTVVGFAPGTSVTQAPGPAAACGTKSGTVGTTSLLSDATKATDASSERVAVSGTDCKTYIINNNNWGQQTSTYQALDYVGNSFTVNVTSGSGGGANVVSFPSIYIGGNGNLGVGGAFNTWADSGLPKQISAIKSAKSTFQWSGGNSGNYNAAYDIWFAKSSPTPGYNDAVSGFIMIWTFKPGSSQPIGDAGKTRPATIDGKGYHVWRGGRNATATGTDGTGRPVISYVADSTNNSFSSDLKLFFDDAVKNAADDMSNGTPAITQAFANSWYLTDVFAGFEIWNGSDAKGLKDTFTCVIQ